MSTEITKRSEPVLCGKVKVAENLTAKLCNKTMLKGEIKQKALSATE